MARAQMLIFLSAFTAVYLGMHYYVYFRVAQGLMLSGRAALILRACIYAGALLFIGGEFLLRTTSAAWARPILLAGTTWLGMLSIAVTVFVVLDLVCMFFPGLRASGTAVALAVIWSLAVTALVTVARGPIVRRVEIAVPAAAQKLAGYRIAHLSDIHLNSLTPTERVAALVRQVNALAPDLIVITGDLIDADLCRVDGICQNLGRFSAPEGVFAVTGNHEYYAGYRTFLDIARSAGIRVLSNESVMLPRGIELAGINDSEARRFGFAAPDLERVTGPRRPQTLLRVLLAHRPDVFDAARARSVDLQLSGHVHAGQIPPISFLVHLVFRYPVGLYRRYGSVLYTSPGTGTWGPPMRLGSRSEITLIVLK